MEKVIRGIRNKNPFNIKISNNSWLGKINVKRNTDKTFEQFRELDYGLRAGIQLLRGYIIRGFDTPESIISRFAPSSENDSKSYLKFVCNVCNFAPDVNLRCNSIEFYRLCAAICTYESKYDLSLDKYRAVCTRFRIYNTV